MAEAKVTLGINSSPLISGLRKASAALGSFASGVGSKLRSAIASPIAAIGGLIAGALGAGAFVSGIKGAIDLGGTLTDLKARTGSTASELLILRQAFVDNGNDAESVGGVLNKLQRVLTVAAAGGRMASAAFDEIGLSARALISLTPAKQFEAVAKAISGIADPAKRANAAISIFGKSGGQLLSVFADSGAIDNAAKSLGKQAQILEKNSDAFDTIGDRLGRAGLKLQGFFVGVTSGLVPALTSLTSVLDGLDFADQGVRFGEGIAIAAKYIIGVFQDPGALLDGLGAYLKYVAAEFFTTFYNLGKKAAEMFGADVKDSLTRGLIGAAKALSPFAQITADIAEKGLGLGGESNHASDDPFGAKGLLRIATEAFGKLGQAGQKWIDKNSAEDAKVPAPKDRDASSLITGHLTGATNIVPGAFRQFFSPGNTSLTGGSLDRKAYGQTPILSLRERRAMQDADVANGGTRIGSAGAHDVVRRGDRQRRREVEREKLRKKDTGEITNDLLVTQNGILKQGLLDP